MMIRVALLLSLGAGLVQSGHAADEVPKNSVRDRLKARIAEDAKKVDAKKTSSAAAAPTSTQAAADPSHTAPTTQPTSSPTAKATKSADKKAPKEPATLLPAVEVKKGRITQLDQQLALQEQEIAREKKNLKSTETDSALNDAKLAKPLAIFGGESTQFRRRVANERVELMEAEKDLMEAIAQAKTKEEKAALQQQLDALKAMRRELDKTLR